jgi:hypothetical protein
MIARRRRVAVCPEFGSKRRDSWLQPAFGDTMASRRAQPILHRHVKPSFTEEEDLGCGASDGDLLASPLDLTVLAAWIHERLLPFLQEFVRLAGAMQIGKARDLSANFLDAFVQVWVFQIAGIIKFLPCLGN